MRNRPEGNGPFPGLEFMRGLPEGGPFLCPEDSGGNANFSGLFFGFLVK
jgi:hypothetical protein